MTVKSICTLGLAALATATAEAQQNPQSGSERVLVIQQPLLNLPVKNGAPKRRMQLLAGGEVVRDFEIELAAEAPDFWVFMDTAPFMNQRVLLTVDPPCPSGLLAAEPSDRIKGAEDLYREARRPQLHFSSRRGWNNDPNGLMYYAGEYHLFYQHNPYGWSWGNMHWGHAISRDLVHWQEQPVALYPHKFGDWVFSGSAVVDVENTSGFKAGREKPLVAAYTSTGRGECIVFSNDRGRSWTEYPGNPVIRHQGRDPRLLWHRLSNSWVMAVYDETDKKQWIAFYTSPDLKRWTFASRIEGFYECPDLFELSLEGQGMSKWVLSAANSEYMVGTFDGKTFTPETPKLPGVVGPAFYAAQTFSDIPRRDGRRIQIGWARIETRGMPFNQMMFLPTEMTLRSTLSGPRLAWAPVAELTKLRQVPHHWRNQQLQPGDSLTEEFRSELLEMHVAMKAETGSSAVFSLCGVPIRYEADRKELLCQDQRRELHVTARGQIEFTVLLDRTSIEVFADDGLVYMPLAARPQLRNLAFRLQAEKNAVAIDDLQIYELKSIWQ